MLIEHNFLPVAEIDRLQKAVADAEKQTSGEIRLYFEKKCHGNPIDRALQVFQELGMHQTVLHNAVLIYVAYKSRHFAIIGDEAIHSVVQQKFWDEMHQIAQKHFTNNDAVEGLSLIISRIGTELKNYFQHRNDDINELPDEIIIK